MSYTIVKSIKIAENGDVFIKGASNNVKPRDGTTEKYEYFDQFSTKEEKEIEILKGYETGDLQPGSLNKYSRALEILKHFPEYEKFDGRNSQNDEYREKNEKEFKELLRKALNTPYPKEKYAIIKRDNQQILYLYHRRHSGYGVGTSDQKLATTFAGKEDAEKTKSCFTNSDGWEVIQL